MAYEHTAAQIYRLPDDEASLILLAENHTDKRFVGKIGELSLGFGGGWRAYVKMAKQYGVEGISKEFAEQIKEEWRAANVPVTDLWEELEEAFKLAIIYPGEIFKAANGRIMFCCEGRWLKMRLPSGRKIHYLDPEVHDSSRGPVATYMGINTETRQWGRVKTYGGKILQNNCEGIGRDALVHGCFNAEKTGRYPTIGMVHDEGIFEPKIGEGDLDELTELLCDKPSWAKGLPVGGSGFVARRYKKD